MPGGLTGTVTKFQDNQVQTNFWAAFLAEANTMNAQLPGLRMVNRRPPATGPADPELPEFRRHFDPAQGAVFQGRFDNELVAGALEADPPPR